MYILISHFTWLLQWFIILDINNLVNVSHHYWTLYWNCQSSEINMSSKMGDSLFKLGRYNRVFLEIWSQIHIWAPMLKQWAVGFFSRENTTEEFKGSTKVIFFIKTSKWEKWWSWLLRMTNAFILCNLFWKVQKLLAANREGSFNYSAQLPQWYCSSYKTPVLQRVCNLTAEGL